MMGKRVEEHTHNTASKELFVGETLTHTRSTRRGKGREEETRCLFFANSVTVLTVDGWECHCGQREGITRHEAN